MREPVIALVCVLALAGCGGTSGPEEGSGESQPADTASSTETSETPASPPANASAEDSEQSEQSSEDAGASGPSGGASDSGAQSSDPSSLPTDSEGWFPNDFRCQVEGNQTLYVPGGTLISVDVFNVVTGEKVYSLGGALPTEVLDALDAIEDWEDWKSWLRRVPAALTTWGSPEEQLGALLAVSERDLFRSPAYLGFAREWWDREGAVIDLEPVPKGRVRELAAAQLGTLSDEEKREVDRLSAQAVNLLIPLASTAKYGARDAAEPDNPRESFLEELQAVSQSHELAHLSFICGYLFGMGDWGSLLQHWGSANHPALAYFTETLSRIHAAGDLHSAVIAHSSPSTRRDGLGSDALLTSLKSDVARITVMQAYGITMAPVGSLANDSYPYVYVTVEDGGRRMFSGIAEPDDHITPSDCLVPEPDPEMCP